MGLFSKKKTEDKVEDKSPKVDEKADVKKVEDSPVLVSDSVNKVVISPIMTEKSHAMSDKGKYLFKISSKATKKNIKGAIEEMYKVNVDKINVLTVSKKKRTVKYDRGYQKSYKKAIVTFKKGQSISVFEGV